MFTHKISHKYTRTYLKKYYFSDILFNVSFMVDASLIGLQYSVPTLSMIIKDQFFVQC